MKSLRFRVSFLPVLCALLTVLSCSSAPAQVAYDSFLLDYWEDLYAPSVIPSPFDWLVAPVWGTYYSRELLAKASPDECFYGVAEEGEPPLPPQPLPCGEGGVPKVNEAYVWGLAKVGNNIWFGTAPNVHCLVLGGYLGLTTPQETDSWVCEFGRSWYANPPLDLPDAAGDWRPPKIYMYNTATKALTDMSNLPAAPPGLHLQRLRATSGIRSAGSLGNIVFLGGPSLSRQGGINLFAFNGTTGEFLGSRTLAAYNNIRKWIAVKGQLYVGVGNTPPPAGGSILRWVNKPANPDYPFEFEVVGQIDGAAAELAYHEGRLFVTTWPTLVAGGGIPPLAGLWMSPKVPKKGGLSAAHAGLWQKMWQSDDYEPDPVTAVTYGGGALESFQGYLYWGTMHVPGLSMVAHAQIYGQTTDTVQTIDAVLGTYRPISIFRGKRFGKKKPPVIELLYGLSEMPAYNGAAWQILPNNMGGAEPRFGLAGFDNFFNNYTWTMAVYDKRLFVGTMDFSYLIADLIEDLGLGEDPTDLSISDPGADLIMFHSAKQAGQAISKDGLDNFANYGVRTMLVSDGLYLGTANPMNLMPQGGWELHRIAKIPKKKK
ncbi:MAG: hypothetical protein JXB04_03395 [Kiritimatiellae bacterium]|nr:hypothetical protein [Kiritimatiellia bacterium]